MKKLTLLILSLMVVAGVSAQNATAYFMDGSTFRSQFNPAFAPQRGYVNIPVVGGVNASMEGNLALDNILFSRDGKLVTLLDTSVSATDALGNLEANNILGLDLRMNLIGIGSYTKNRKNFWSFDLSLRNQEEVDLPYELFDFLKSGKEGNIANLGLGTSTYLEAAFSYSMPLIKDKLYVGARVKFLVGAMRANMNFDRFDVSLKDDRWSVDAQGSLDVTACGLDAQSVTVDDEGNFTMDDIEIDTFKPAGYGVAFDLGATYNLLPNLQFSLAVTDLGVMSWDKNSTVNGVVTKELEFTGVEVDTDGNTSQPDFDLDVLEFKKQDSAKAGAKFLNANINAGAEYKILNRRLGFGLLYQARILEYKTMHNVTAAVNFQPVRWFTLAASYSVLHNRGNAVGLAVNFTPGFINLFLGTDLLTSKHTPQWIPVSQSKMNLTFGLGVPIGKRGERQ